MKARYWSFQISIFSSHCWFHKILPQNSWILNQKVHEYVRSLLRNNSTKFRLELKSLVQSSPFWSFHSFWEDWDQVQSENFQDCPGPGPGPTRTSSGQSSPRRDEASSVMAQALEQWLNSPWQWAPISFLLCACNQTMVKPLNLVFDARCRPLLFSTLPTHLSTPHHPSPHLSHHPLPFAHSPSRPPHLFSVVYRHVMHKRAIFVHVCWLVMCRFAMFDMSVHPADTWCPHSQCWRILGLSWHICCPSWAIIHCACSSVWYLAVLVHWFAMATVPVTIWACQLPYQCLQWPDCPFVMLEGHWVSCPHICHPSFTPLMRGVPHVCACPPAVHFWPPHSLTCQPHAASTQPPMTLCHFKFGVNSSHTTPTSPSSVMPSSMMPPCGRALVSHPWPPLRLTHCPLPVAQSCTCRPNNCILHSCSCIKSVDANQVMDSDGIVDVLNTFTNGLKQVWSHAHLLFLMNMKCFLRQIRHYIPSHINYSCSRDSTNNSPSSSTTSSLPLPSLVASIHLIYFRYSKHEAGLLCYVFFPAS